MNPNLFRQRDNVAEFCRQSQGKSPMEKRRLELALMKPVPSPKAIEENPLPYNPITQYIKMYFPDTEDYRMMIDFLRVSHSVETSSKDVALFIAVVRQIKDGSLVWDKENKRLVCGEKDEAVG